MRSTECNCGPGSVPRRAGWAAQYVPQPHDQTVQPGDEFRRRLNRAGGIELASDSLQRGLQPVGHDVHVFRVVAVGLLGLGHDDSSPDAWANEPGSCHNVKPVIEPWNMEHDRTVIVHGLGEALAAL